MVADMARSLCALAPEGWDLYAFANEPLAGKYTQEQKRAFFREASACGEALARTLRKRYPGAAVAQIAEAEGAKLIAEGRAEDNGFLAFATYTEPDEIRIFQDNARETDMLIMENSLSDLTGGVETADVLAAHELYHYLEDRDPSLYTAQKHALALKIGRWERRSRIRCLAEIGAMAFAQTLVSLPCSPYVFDVLMLGASSPQRALRLHQSIMKLCGGKGA